MSSQRAITQARNRLQKLMDLTTFERVRKGTHDAYSAYFDIVPYPLAIQMIDVLMAENRLRQKVNNCVFAVKLLLCSNLFFGLSFFVLMWEKYL